MISKNLKAFLDTIAWSEGTTRIKGNKDGYNVLVGGGLFADMTNHPHKLITLNAKLKSTAAGRYQLLGRYYDFYAKLLGLKDFSPASQDAIAIQQIKERKALDDIESGRFDAAVTKCKNIWASLPGAGYGQHENSMTKLMAMYQSYGGEIA